MSVARLLPDVRNHMNNHDALRRRLVNMPWNRNISLGTTDSRRNERSTSLGKINEQVPAMMKTLATRPVEDEDFNFKPWQPKLTRKTLLPIPEQLHQNNDALEDTHEAILEAMEPEEPHHEDEIVREDEMTDDETFQEKNLGITRQRLWREPEAQALAKQAEKVADANIEPILEDVEPEPPQQKPPKSIEVSESAEIEHLHIMMKKLGLSNEYSQDGDVTNQISEIRRCLAKNVGIEPRDVRVDRMLRLILRLLPQSNEHDGKRKVLIMKIASGLKRYQNWVKMRLEARHKAAKNNLILDSAILG